MKVRFNVKTDDPDLSFIVDCDMGGDVLDRAQDAVERWNRATGKTRLVAAIQIIVVLED